MRQPGPQPHHLPLLPRALRPLRPLLRLPHLLPFDRHPCLQLVRRSRRILALRAHLRRARRHTSRLRRRAVRTPLVSPLDHRLYTVRHAFADALLAFLAVVIVALLVAAAGVLLAGPEAGEHDLLEARLDAALVKPGVQATLDELCDLGHVLEAGATAEEGADGEVEAVII